VSPECCYHSCEPRSGSPDLANCLVTVLLPRCYSSCWLRCPNTSWVYVSSNSVVVSSKVWRTACSRPPNFHPSYHVAHPITFDFFVTFLRASLMLPASRHRDRVSVLALYPFIVRLPISSHVSDGRLGDAQASRHRPVRLPCQRALKTGHRWALENQPL
jgi:hypothetical protein